MLQPTAIFVERDMRRQPSLLKTTMVAETAPIPADQGPPANYLDLYGLSKPPFGGPPDSATYILFNSHRRVIEALIDHVVSGSGLIVLQGEDGIGKTETLRAAAASVAAESELRTVIVSRPPNGRITLMQLVSALQGRPGAEQTSADDAIAQFLAPPRRALLLDDVDLMPEDCVRLLIALTQRIADQSNGPALVATSSIDLTTAPERPDLAEFAALVRNTLRLPPLAPFEVQQYIERSLWISGGTTRRLITTDAMKLLIARSGGVPAAISRLMEAVLMAGFARGDSMITAKTVAAATGPTAAPRPHRQPVGLSGTAAHAMQIVAIGLFVLGTSVFLYRGLTGRPDRPSSAVPEPRAAAPPAPVIVRPQPASQPTETLPPELMTALMKRGDQAVGLGDIAAARLLYQRAADAGSAPASTALAKTFDPNYAAPGQTPDPARAAEWYSKALALGDPHAGDLLKKLEGR